MDKQELSFKVIKWTPRIFVILFIAFISIFSLDVFGAGYSFFETIIGFLMHNIPTFALIGLLIVSWKWPKIGGISFLILGVLFTFFFNTYREPISFMLISFPVFLVGAMFLISDYIEKKK